jgi:uncharacterized membrane protein
MSLKMAFNFTVTEELLKISLKKVRMALILIILIAAILL